MSDALVIGGAGFIGSHLVRRLLERDGGRVTVYDNFSSGQDWHLEPVAGDPRLAVVRGDVKDLDDLVAAARGHDTAFLLASNPDIAAAATDPAIDFWEGTYLVQNTVEACRLGAVGTLVYASGSGVYGDQGAAELDESFGPLLPVSTYGAGKLAGEALISAYCHLFGLRGVAFRFANVVGPRQTHGVVFDFVRKLLRDPTRLEVLGDGSQSKSYIHVDDVLDAVLLLAADPPTPFDVFNAATEDYVTVREIAGVVVEAMGLSERGAGVRGHAGRVEGRRARGALLVGQAARARLGQPAHEPRGAARVGAGAARGGQGRHERDRRAQRRRRLGRRAPLLAGAAPPAAADRRRRARPRAGRGARRRLRAAVPARRAARAPGRALLRLRRLRRRGARPGLGRRSPTSCAWSTSSARRGPTGARSTSWSAARCSSTSPTGARPWTTSCR